MMRFVDPLSGTRETLRPAMLRAMTVPPLWQYFSPRVAPVLVTLYGKVWTCPMFGPNQTGYTPKSRSSGVG
jgi:hypothetical protein